MEKQFNGKAIYSPSLKPQERPIDGIIEYKKNGKSYKDKKVYSIPCERCNGCPVYQIDENITPIAYYCRAEFLFGIFNKAIKDKTIPSICEIDAVCNAKKFL